MCRGGGAPRGCAQAGATQQEGMGDANGVFASPISFAHPLACHVARRVGRALTAGAGERRDKGCCHFFPRLPIHGDASFMCYLSLLFICSILSLRKQKKRSLNLSEDGQVCSSRDAARDVRGVASWASSCQRLPVEPDISRRCLPLPRPRPNPTDATSTAPIFIPVGQLPSQKQDSLVNECSKKLDFKARNSGPLDLRLISDPDSFMTQTV